MTQQGACQRKQTQVVKLPSRRVQAWWGNFPIRAEEVGVFTQICQALTNREQVKTLSKARRRPALAPGILAANDRSLEECLAAC